MNIIQTPEVGKFVVIKTEGSTFTKYGTIAEVTTKWIRIDGFKNTRSGWILRDSLTACYTPSTIRIPISFYDH
jgi:hypothetical protein